MEIKKWKENFQKFISKCWRKRRNYWTFENANSLNPNPNHLYLKKKISDNFLSNKFSLKRRRKERKEAARKWDGLERAVGRWELTIWWKDRSAITSTRQFESSMRLSGDYFDSARDLIDSRHRSNSHHNYEVGNSSGTHWMEHEISQNCNSLKQSLNAFKWNCSIQWY